MAFTPEIALEYLRSAQQRDRLAHSYLITGAPGSGKRGLAAGLAQVINGAAPDDVFAGTAANIYLAAPASKSRRIVIEQIRELEHALQMRAERRKIAIIAEADRMQPQAANALLKTLEEPPNNSMLLLLSEIPEALPETILSRCIEIALVSPNELKPSPEEIELAALLNTADPAAKDGVHQAYRLASGFQRLLGQIREKIQEENDAALKREQARYKNTTGGEWLDSREDYYKALTESRYLQQRAQLLETLFLWWSDVLRVSAQVEARELPTAGKSTDAVAARLTTPEVLRRIRRLEELRDHLGRNVQEALALEVAFLNVFRF